MTPSLPADGRAPKRGDRAQITESMDVTQGKLVIGMRTGITASDPDYPASCYSTPSTAAA